MLNNLNPQQKELMAKIRREYLDFVFKSKKKLSHKQAIEKIHWLYDFCKLGKPVVVVVDSPLGCQIAANMLGGNQVKNQVGNRVWNQVENQVWKQVRNQVGDQVWNQVESRVGNQVGNQVGDQVGNQVENQVWSQVENQVWNQVENQVESQVKSQVGNQVWNQVWNQVESRVGKQVEKQVENQVGTFFSFSWRDTLGDSGWLSFYDYFFQIGIVKNNNLEKYKEYHRLGIFFSIFLEGLVIVCGRPSSINRDSENQLHCENSQAILWNDGYKSYFWHGVVVPEKLIETPEKITKEDILGETNVEVRRAMREKLGTDKFASLLDLKVVASDTLNNQEYILLRTREKDAVADEHINFLKVICPSTNREYFLTVPPDIDEPLRALAWTFGMQKDEYKPLVET